MNCRAFVDRLCKYSLLKKDCTAWCWLVAENQDLILLLLVPFAWFTPFCKMAEVSIQDLKCPQRQ